ncbi:MAG: hypothetical protein M1812_003086 [Candelaria pacifica]|nr:MAG: hypothetical protein M1812_003086 [Candelaria pacifica]
MSTQDPNGDALLDKLRTLSMGHATATDLHAPLAVDTPKKELSQHQAASAPSTVHAQQRTPSRRSPSSSGFSQIVSTPTSKDRRSILPALGTAAPVSPRNASRRSSSNIGPSPINALSKSNETALDESAESSPTAATVACAHFRQELQQHDQPELVANLKTVVIMHDSCYGHRYSRPRTTKTNLSTIVERPERIQASLLGVAAAYVRLGRKYSEAAQSDGSETTSSLSASLPFRIRKTARSVDLTSPVITSIHGTKWMEELKVMCEVAESKLVLSGKELVRPDGENASTEPGGKPKLHEGDLYLCSDSLDALRGAIGGVCDGVDAVFAQREKGTGARRSFVCIRPPGHHCSSDYPSGFCWLNNVHIGISHASMMHGLTHAAIIDFDLHHGDGSQAITWEHNAKATRLPKNAVNSKKTAIGYFSLHDINSYPCEMGDEEKVRNASVCLENCHGQTVWNVHLDSWKDESEFWSIYEHKYSILIDKARSFLRTHTERLKSLTNQPSPKAAIFISAGFDASEWESSGMQRHKVNVPTSFYARFTRDIVLLSEETATGVDGRIISVLEGGYSDRALTSGVLSHLSGLAADEAPERSEQGSGLGYEMRKRIGTYDAESNTTDQAPTVVLRPDWWELPRLEELEAVVNPTAAAPPAPKKSRNTSRPTYSSTTQSFNAKIVPGSTIYRNVSAGSPRTANLTSSRTPTPTPPDIHWSIATHELSKLLIPTDRQTSSCKPEDLGAPASRVRRERHSIGLPSDVEVHDGRRMQLRERKIKTPSYALEEEGEQPQFKRPPPKPSRRTTIGGAAIQAGKPTTKAENHKAEKSKQSTGNSKRRPSVSSKRSLGDGAVPPVPHIVNNATELVSEVPRTDGLHLNNPLSVPSNSSSRKQVVARNNMDVGGPSTEVTTTRPSKRVQPVVKGSSTQPSNPPKSSSPTQSTLPPVQRNIQNPNQTEKNQPFDDLASDLKELSIKGALPVKTQGVNEAISANEGVINNRASTFTSGQREISQSLSNGNPSRTTTSEVSALSLGADDLGREKLKYLGRNDDFLPNKHGPTRDLQSAFPPLAIAPSDHRAAPGTLMVDGIEPGTKGQAKPIPSSGSSLESTPATAGNESKIEASHGLIQPVSAKHRGDLPVFTADSLIPFGKLNENRSDNKTEHSPSRSHLTSTTDTTGSPVNNRQGGANGSCSLATQEVTSKVQHVRDVWDVPETPHRLG